MAVIYSNDFNANTTGAAITTIGYASISGGWIVRTDANPVNTKSIYPTGNGTSGDSFLYTALGALGDTIWTFQYKGSNTKTDRVDLVFRADITFANGYYISCPPDMSSVRLIKRVSGVDYALKSIQGLPPVWTAGLQNIQVEVSSIGNVHDFRIWNLTLGQSRPTNPTFQFTDTSGAPYTTGYLGGRLTTANAVIPSVDNVSIDDAPSVTAQTPVLIATNNAAVKFSPYSSDFNGTTVDWINNNSYVEFNFTSGAAGTFGIDFSPLATGTTGPTFRIIIDNFAYTFSMNGAPSKQNFMVANLPSGSHVMRVEYVTYAAGSATWARTVAMKFLQFVLDVGQSASAIAAKPNYILSYGDSQTKGTGNNSATLGIGANDDGTRSVAALVAYGINAEFGQIGFPSQGYGVAGDGSVPALASAWDSYSSGRSRLSGGQLSPSPTALISYHGVNSDNSATTVGNQIIAWRAAVNTTTPIILVINPGRRNTSSIFAAVAARNAAGDNYVYIVDPGSDFVAALGVTTVGATPYYWSPDALHPYDTANARIAARVSYMINQIIQRRFNVIGS